MSTSNCYTFNSKINLKPPQSYLDSCKIYLNLKKRIFESMYTLGWLKKNEVPLICGLTLQKHKCEFFKNCFTKEILDCIFSQVIKKFLVLPKYRRKWSEKGIK